MEQNHILQVDNLYMDLLRRTVRRGNFDIRLNPKEFRLLEYLMRNQGIALTRLKLLENVWDEDTDQFSNTVDVHIRFLRTKIDERWKKKLIHTVHGFGYKLEA
jgi:DNA-binding response OmpR family regulator